MARFNVVIVFAALAAVGCSSPTDPECQAGYQVCDGACVAVHADPENCGACGVACGAAQACVGGACVADCGASLHAAITDPWGLEWDGLERPAVSFTAARTACEEIGGRLPTVSELYRVSAVESAAVGDTYKVHTLWALTPNDNTSVHTVRLSDGAVATSVFAPATLPNYRCVCPPPRPDAFVEGACYGEPDEGCAPLGGDPRFNFDAKDRPPVTKAGAIFECAFAGGELPSAERLAAAVYGGLPNGANVALHTADDTGATTPVDAQLKFTAGTPSITDASLVTQQRFRCFGPAAVGAEAATVLGGFLEPRGERVVDGADAAAKTYSEAVGSCFAAAGHLPTATELAAMAMQGLPAGDLSGARWTSDQLASGYAMTFAWAGTAKWPIGGGTYDRDGVPYAWSTASLQQLLKSDATGLPYRCIHFAVDRRYAAPADASCSGNDCVELKVGGSTSTDPRRMWFDLSNRGGTASDTYLSAVEACSDLGGRLPSARDLVEAIRNGLYGSGDALVTSDLVTGGPLARTVTWTGTINPSFPDTAATTVTLSATGVKYRCMWTNEVR